MERTTDIESEAEPAELYEDLAIEHARRTKLPAGSLYQFPTAKFGLCVVGLAGHTPDEAAVLVDASRRAMAERGLLTRADGTLPYPGTYVAEVPPVERADSLHQQQLREAEAKIGAGDTTPPAITQDTSGAATKLQVGKILALKRRSKGRPIVTDYCREHNASLVKDLSKNEPSALLDTLRDAGVS